MSDRLSLLQSAVKAFTKSSQSFRVITSLPASASASLPRTLLVLDSSFNPPTLAHLRMCLSSLSDPSYLSPRRLVLLLATNNADKPPKPAAFEQRLVMMEMFAKEILCASSGSAKDTDGGSHQSIASKRDNELREDLMVDIALTSAPYFSGKADSISSSGMYPVGTEQVMLTGFDTLIRILDPNYYDQERKLSVLDGFFEKHRVRVTFRADDQWGGRAEQDEYLERIRRGERDEDGAQGQWVSKGRIKMVEARKEGQEVISSSKVRDLVKEGKSETWKSMVPISVAQLVEEEHLYREDY